jgi:HEAT repeat protein
MLSKRSPCGRGVASTFLALLLCSPFLFAADSDPVEQLRAALRDATNPEELAARQAELDKHIKALSGIEQLRRALMFEEWRRGEDSTDQAGYKALAEKFLGTLRARMEKGTTVQKQAAATLAGDLGTTIRGIRGAGGLMRELTPDLIKLCDSEDSTVREAAARALGRINPEADTAAEALGRLLGHKEAGSRRAAADGLAALLRTTASLLRNRGPEAGEETASIAVAVVKQAARGLGDSDSQARRSCLEAIQLAAALFETLVQYYPGGFGFGFSPKGKLSEEKRGQLESFRKAVEDERARVLPLASSLNDQAAAVAKSLAAEDIAVCEMAALALEKMTEARTRLRLKAAAVPAAVRREKNDPLDEDPLRAGLLAAVPSLVKTLGRKEVRGRIAAFYVLETLEEDAAGAGDAVAQSLADESPYVRWGAARVLSKIAPQSAAKAVPALARALDDDNGDVRQTAVLALERYGPAAKGAAAALARASGHKDASMRVPAINALAAVGGDAKEITPFLVKALADTEADVREAAARALGKLGAIDAAATAALRKALSDPDVKVRQAASTALLGP